MKERDAYEDIADFMLGTMTGAASCKAAGLNREGLIQVIRNRFPDEAQLRAESERLSAQAKKMFPPPPPH